MGVLQSNMKRPKGREQSLPQAFQTLAHNPESSSWPAVECALDTLTYAQLWFISRGLTDELQGQYGSLEGHVVAVIGENHPYILALILGVWAVGGTVAVLDAHAPKALMEGMLTIVAARCVVLPSTDLANAEVVQSMQIFQPETSTIPALLARYESLKVPPDFRPQRSISLPSPNAIALLIFTSSASSTSTLKPVPLSHASIYCNCRSQLAWLSSPSSYAHRWPNKTPARLRVLGWAPFSHIMALSHDIGTYMILTGGCYIFAVPPSTYPQRVTAPSVNVPNSATSLAVSEALRDALVAKKPDVLGGVPWIFEELMQLHTQRSSPDEELIKALARLRVCITGGAEPSPSLVKWAVEMKIPLVLDIGMTELGEPSDGFEREAIMEEVHAAVGRANRDLAPPLRIAWSRILVLNRGEALPLTRKKAIFRKKMGDLYKARLIETIRASDTILSSRSGINGVASTVSRVVSRCLSIDDDFLRENQDCTFAELGMDSACAITIITRLNSAFSPHLQLPSNSCHVYVDLQQLTSFIAQQLETSAAPHSVISNSSLMSPPTASGDDVVIVGQALRLPGGLNTPDLFWDALVQRRDDILTPTPRDRWDQDSFRPSGSPKPGDILFERAGFVNSHSFDNAFFGITEPEALMISPAVRLTMEVALDALEDANIPIARVRGTDIAVFVATGPDEGYSQLLHLQSGFDGSFYDPARWTSSNICTNSLQQVQWDGPGKFAFLSAQQMASPQGRCATFSKDADGYAPSEGAVAFIIKARAAALRDKDRILGVIKASAVQHNGRSQGLVAPNVQAQISLQRHLLKKSSLSPSKIQFVEAHGTGTKIGDLLEMQGICEVFDSSHSSFDPLIIGASKTCVGHTESAAGLVGIVKALLSFKYHMVPGLVHLSGDNLNPEINCGSVPLIVPWRNTPLKPNKSEPGHAMVLAYGFAGTIAGAVLEGIPELPRACTPISAGNLCAMFAISAKTSQGLQAYTNQYLEYCCKRPPETFHDVCYTTTSSREHYRYRFACVPKDMQDLINRLKAASSLPHSKPTRPRLVFGFPGQGSQYQGMARELAQANLDFKYILTRVAELASEIAGFSVISFLLDSTAPPGLDIDESRHAQVCIFVYQYSVFQWLKGLAILPDAVLGHSIGEIAAAVASEAMDLSTGLHLVISRANSMRPKPGESASMAAVSATLEAIEQMIDDLHLRKQVVVAVHNSNNSHVVSGINSAVELLVQSFKSRGMMAEKLNVDQAFHSPLISTHLEPFSQWLQQHSSQLRGPKLPYYSTSQVACLTGTTILDSLYWLDHAKNPVRFAHTVDLIQHEKVPSIILDIGPQPTIRSALRSLPPGSQTTSLALCGKKGKDQDRSMITAISILFQNNVTPDFSSFHSQRRYQFSKIAIPTYPWQRQRHYPTVIPSRNSRYGNHSAATSSSSSGADTWIIGKALYDLLDDHRIQGHRVLPGAALAAFTALSPAHPSSFAVHYIQFHKPLVVHAADTAIHLSISGSSFVVSHEDGSSERICSGTLMPRNIRLEINGISTLHEDNVPSQILDQSEVYSYFKHVTFLPLFQNLRRLVFFDDHVDGIINLGQNMDPSLDRIRLLDACLHMFGALNRGAAPEASGPVEGAFLPSSLSEFVMHVNDLPANITCRYQLPINRERNGHLMSTSFQVLSDAGDLLVSCKRYSAAWIPFEAKFLHRSRHWLSYSWIPRLLPPCTIKPIYQLLLIFNIGSRSADHNLSQLSRKTVHFDLTCPLLTELQNYNSEDVLIILDTRDVKLLKISDAQNLCINLIAVLKCLIQRIGSINGLVLLSSDAIAFDHTAQVPNASLPPFTLTSLFNGLLSVWRRECGLGADTVWGLDLPPSGPAIDEATLIQAELSSRKQSAEQCDSIVSYRRDEIETLTRYTPILRPIEVDTLVTNAKHAHGVVVITGMGSIGKALVLGFRTPVPTAVVFLGRARSTEKKITDDLLELQKGFPEFPIDYSQVDLSDLSSLVDALKSIQQRLGHISAVIHTAGVIKDVVISKLDDNALTEVLTPKISGGWNLHLASQQLNLKLDSFVLLSSISVPLGNRGQAAYVAANSFLDALAAYRTGLGLPGTSFQLGAWESTMTDHLQDDVPIMRHSEGIPLIMRALEAGIRSPVQVIADLDLKQLFKSSGILQDPLWANTVAGLDEPAPDEIGDEGIIDSAMAMERVLSEALRDVLELDRSDLEMTATLADYGVDSIAFTQLAGQIATRVGRRTTDHNSRAVRIELPMVFLSDSFSLSDIVDHLWSRVRPDHRTEGAA
ncbi:hypothetical protein HWV62_41795 [Athelia sp. TMB]|nr:hypothetical protein HWV62_41795 [Athelia sp. TMB]